MNDLFNQLDGNARQAILTDLADLMQTALTLQGPSALECSRGHAAFHEAGHAIAHHVHHQTIRSIKVYQKGAHWLGRCSAGPRWSIGPDTDPQADLTQAQILLAGPLGELLFSRKPALAGGLDEIVLARAIVEQAAGKLDRDPEGVLMALLLSTLQMLTDYRPALDEIARRLMRKPKLDGATVTAILRTAGPSRRAPSAVVPAATFR